MLTEVRSQLRITFLSVKYAIMREMLNKITFITNVIFMILNNACMIIQWIIFYSIKDNIGGYTFKQILLLWGLAAGTYGFSHFFFKRAYELSETINTGKLDSYLVQPKNVLLSAITSDIEVSALGDILYSYILLIIYGITLPNFLLFTLFIICGGIVMSAISVILASLSFWYQKSDVISETGNSLMVNFATYPDGIFKGVVKLLLFTIIPIGITTYLPVHILTTFNPIFLLIVISSTISITLLAFLIFNKGLRKYSSSNLMIARI